MKAEVTVYVGYTVQVKDRAWRVGALALARVSNRANSHFFFDEPTAVANLVRLPAEILLHSILYGCMSTFLQLYLLPLTSLYIYMYIFENVRL